MCVIICLCLSPQCDTGAVSKVALRSACCELLWASAVCSCKCVNSSYLMFWERGSAPVAPASTTGGRHCAPEPMHSLYKGVSGGKSHCGTLQLIYYFVTRAGKCFQTENTNLFMRVKMFGFYWSKQKEGTGDVLLLESLKWSLRRGSQWTCLVFGGTFLQEIHPLMKSKPILSIYGWNLPAAWL